MALVKVHTHGRVTQIVLNRPRQLNALSPNLLDSLIDTCETIAQSDASVVVLRGAEGAFSAGADLSSFAEKLMGPDAHAAADLGRRATSALAALPQLKIAWIDGVCIGGGLVLASVCDLRWTSPQSQFSLPELAIGIPVGWGGTERVVKIIGLARAKALTFEATPITAQRALEAGLVSQICPTTEDFENALQRICEIPTFSLEATQKQFTDIQANAFNPLDDAQLMVDALRRPEVLEKLMTAWQNKSSN